MYWSLPSWPMLYLYTGGVAFILSAFLMPLCVRMLRRYKIMDELSDAKIHKTPTPRGGGIVIFIAFAIAVVLPNYRDNPMKGVLLGSFICLLVGAIDDLRGGVPAVIKLAALTSATLIMSFFVAGTETSLSWFGLLASGLIGANLGFLLYNFRPAKVFMGDSGSFFLGFTLAALGVMGEWADHRVVACTIPVLILGMPIFDFGYVLVTRILNGETRTVRGVIEHCAPDHLSHRLVWFGFSQRNAVLFIYMMSFALGTSGLLLRNSERGFDSILGLVQGGSVLLLIAVLMITSEGRHVKTAPHDAKPVLLKVEPSTETEPEPIRKTA